MRLSLRSLARTAAAATPVSSSTVPPTAETARTRAATRSVVEDRALDAAIDHGASALVGAQATDGFWRFDLEADASITAEYILMMHSMDEIEAPLQAKLASYLRSIQAGSGGWGLFPDGPIDLSCSVKAYYALKLAGDDPSTPHMASARAAILALGGAARANVFTRIRLALFGQIPWRGVPVLPVEIVLLPRWFPFHLHKVSYWSRTVMVPLAILCSLKARAKNPNRVNIRELFVTPPEEERDYFQVRGRLNRAFTTLDALGRVGEHKLLPPSRRRAAIARAARWFIARLNGIDGLGGIFPAIVNAYEALAALGYGYDHPYRVQTRTALRNLLVHGEASSWCQPCMSPVWDTALAALALQEVADENSHKAADHALDWLVSRQIPDGEPGDWRAARPEARGGGWAFQFANPHYPDLDDTAAVVWAFTRSNQAKRYSASLASAVDWIVGMQSRNGGFGAFDADNTYRLLNEIPFADHGALLDPPTSDVSARCGLALARAARPRDRAALARCIEFLRREQEEPGAWYGRWGTNYVYGTWSVLIALVQIGRPEDQSRIARAVEWLKGRQNADGGWGENCLSYWDNSCVATRTDPSTACQTAWALLGLIEAGEADSVEVERGVAYLLRRQQSNGFWDDPWFNAPGFPRVFFLKYHGYAKYFPLWALARYRNVARGDAAA
jgi:squalene-hopene/tetraprenyl-beta-curcumene cyclase